MKHGLSNAVYVENRMDGRVTPALRQAHVIPREANAVKLRASIRRARGPIPGGTPAVN